ncbi:hypothetical protein FOWG_17515 [Fusarium oxysporum f. sp. lycopersici MN25]|nr:hypothetical protein FOWG_17515 [Fusarium oxysporum f. sp. lycopersici MN25]
MAIGMVFLWRPYLVAPRHRVVGLAKNLMPQRITKHTAKSASASRLGWRISRIGLYESTDILFGRHKHQCRSNSFSREPSLPQSQHDNSSVVCLLDAFSSQEWPGCSHPE